MRKVLTILLSLSVSYFSMAQETVKRKEVGLLFRNLDNFGLTFRIGTDKSVWRFNAFAISGNSTEHTRDSAFSKHTNTGISFQVGKEYRKLLGDKLELRLGADLAFSYSEAKSEQGYDTRDYYDITTKNTSYSPGINLVLGLNYLLTDNILIGAELLPNITYSTGTFVTKNYPSYHEEKSDTSGFNYGLSNSSALLSLAYRF